MPHLNLHILVVDDSVLMLIRIKQLLQDCEVIEKIITTQRFEDAISIIEKEKPDIALIDINLAEKSGIEILSYIKRKKYNIKVIMFTNEVSDNHKELCFKIGTDYFIDKSNDFDKLLPLFSTIAESVNRGTVQ